MLPLTCTRLPPSQRRLLEHFYRQHGSRMRAAGEGEQWVARAGEIVGGMNLTPIEGGHWLTGLFVAPHWRGRQIASRLVDAAVVESSAATWLFCHPDLAPFYQRLAFVPTTTLPQPLASRLARYQRSKALIAMVRSQSSATSSPGNSTSV
ncbi:GNAT family N-acetyltransferase [Pseudomonas maumuensis]|uniref:GNAT family N-acetyltransferase n=1 Tax=Pseudomonas maumuensis TaxID=2842354 RepID=A0ABX8NPL9_9PSED|nr:GNAT family N-acetyltransferase [Pseudomonas maumuensis]QXH57976.1 GNAT family N-acetyltransferase [Pseudomonas maumuensis]